MALFLMLASTPYAWTDLLIFYLDFPTIILFALLSMACVLLSGKKTYPDVLGVLLKVSIPNGVLVTAVTFVTVLVQLSDVSYLGLHLAVCALAIVYAVIEYIVVFCLFQHVGKEL